MDEGVIADGGVGDGKKKKNILYIVHQLLDDRNRGVQ
jgi:hypothetical protein